MAKSDEELNRADDKRRASQAKKAAFARKSLGNGTADWASVDGGMVVRAVAALGAHGGAMRLGYTRDGGAYAIGIYDGDDKQTVYVSPNESVEEVLQEIIDHYGKE